MWLVSPTARIKPGQIAGHVCKKNGYVYIRVDGKIYSAHRLAWAFKNGAFPSQRIDHANRVKTDNRITNLRLTTASGSAANTPIRPDNKSGVRGVRWHKGRQKWVAYRTVNKKYHHLGYFDSIEEASAVSLKFANEVFGEFFCC